MNTVELEECDIYFSNEEYIETSSRESLIFQLIAGTLIAVGILDNVGFLFVVGRIQSMYTVTNFYLANVAVADLGLLSFEASVLITAAVNNPQYDVGFFPFRSDWTCTAGSLFIYTSYFGTVFLVTVVLFDRYMSICYPLRYIVIKGKKKAARITSVLWISAFSMSIFSVGVTNQSQACIQSFNGTIIAKVPVCHWYDFGAWMDWVKLSLDLTQYLIAGAFGIFMIFRIVRTLSNRFVIQKSDQLVAINTRNQIARMLIVNIVFFLVCYLPFKLLDIDYVIGNFVGRGFLPDIHVMLGWCGRLAMLLNASLNPILYNMTSSHYRNAYREAFCSKSPLNVK